ncbi:hypothetical protein BDR03DRAFT_954344 [Suillus americanus]|nr:hypothetical protein BDR03DRAFT_954344 [Suillus americanus]
MMRASAICLSVLSMAVTLVSCRSSASHHLTQSFRALSSPPYKRQSSTPSQCTSICDPVQSEVNAGCPITACCTQSFETSYYNCLLCVGTAYNTTDYSQAQTDLDQLYVACYDYGYSLQELTFPGQNPSRTLSTSSPVGTSTGTSPTSVSVPTSVSASTSIIQTTILPSSTLPASSGTSTSASGTATSSTSTPTTSSAALGLSVGGNGVWAVVAAIGLIVLRNN